jgi:hypothetical protein
MSAFRHAACVLFAASSLLTSPVYATAFSTDQSDLYYIVSESGWGMQLVQRGSVIFATLFVYGPTGQPVWYTATMDYTSNLTWTGQLVLTTGTYFGSAWNPGALTVTFVGTMTWSAQSVNSGVLTYVVNGVTVVKNVVRQALVLDNFSGNFIGGLHQDVTGCANASQDGTGEFGAGFIISENGTAFLLQAGLVPLTMPSAPTTNCAYTGTLTQFGQMGAVPGASFTCSDGSAGTISLTELQITAYALSGSFTATYSNPAMCQTSGWFGGARLTTF